MQDDMPRIAEMASLPHAVGLRRGFGDDGRGGFFNKYSEPVRVGLVDAKGRTPLLLAQQGADAGVPGCREVADLLRTLAGHPNDLHDVDDAGTSTPGHGGSQGEDDDDDEWAEDESYVYSTESD